MSVSFRPPLNPALLRELYAEDEAPPTERRPEIAKFWADVMERVPEIVKQEVAPPDGSGKD